MFKGIDISLTGPICDCDEMDLAWGISRDESGRCGLRISCKICGTELAVPHGKFRAGFRLDQPYRGVKKNVVPLKVLDGGSTDRNSEADQESEKKR